MTGTFLRPPTVEVPSSDVLLSRISIYAARLGGPTEAHITSPNVLASAWKAADGRVAIALVNVTTAAQDVKLRLPDGRYGISQTARVVRHDDAGTKDIGSVGTIANVRIEPLRAVVFELTTNP